MSTTISTHFLSFYRLADNRKWVRAQCSCGWSDEGLPAKVYGKVAGHDLDVPSKHTLYKTGDKDAPDIIKDRNGEVVLGLCKVCGKAERELEQPCCA